MKALLESQAPVDHDRRQDVRLPRDRGAPRFARRKPGDDPRDDRATCARCGREVIYDAEHFFDGWKANPEYAAKTIQAAVEGGAMIVVMCDTNGGSMPEEVAALTKEAAAAVNVPLGIHYAQRLRAGRGQFAGRGRRRRRASAGHDQRPRRALRQRRPDLRHRQPRAQEAGLRSARRHGGSSISPSCRATSTKSANMNFRTNQPFVGHSAFAHKGGMHVHAVARVDQQLRAHRRRKRSATSAAMLVSELSGRSNIVALTTQAQSARRQAR